MKETVNKQRTLYSSGQTKPIEFRIKQLRALHAALITYESVLFDAIYLDFKKSKFDVFTTEIALLHLEIKDAIKNIKKWSKKKKVRTNLVNMPARSYVVPEPLGVSLVIGAWNYPYLLSLGPVIAAIAAGNTVILKPSELAFESSRAMAKMVNKNFDPAFFVVVEGGVSIATELLEQKFDKIFFTGSIPVGKIVYQAAAKNLTPITLELGGKCPAIITENCDLKISVKRLIWAKFLNAGQTCITPDYVLVPKSLEQRFLELAKKEIEKEKFAIENANYVQIINIKNLNRLAGLLEKEKVYCGGGFDEQTRIFEPTILYKVAIEDKVMEEEIFGPILPVLSYSTFDEAIELVKKYEKPLSAYIFTSDKTLKKRFLNELSFGGGGINEAVMHISNSHLPFGGVGSSGTGSYHGIYGFNTFSHFKSILEKPTWIEFNLKYFPHSLSKLSWIKRFMGLK